jgi:CII-binding regulator of phage lambda lysogenization HflD
MIHPFKPVHQIRQFDLSMEHVLSSLARDWLRIISGLLIVEDPEPG